MTGKLPSESGDLRLPSRQRLDLRWSPLVDSPWGQVLHYGTMLDCKT